MTSPLLMLLRSSVSGVAPSLPIPQTTNIFMVGDSTTDGQGSGATNYRDASVCEKLRTALATDGYTVQSDALIGYGRTSDTFPNAVNDSRATYTGSVNANATGRAIASLIQSSDTIISYTPNAPVDTFDIYMATGLGGTLDLDIDGGAVTSPDIGGVQDFKKFTMTAGSVGTHTLNVDLNGFMCGIIASDSTQDQISIVNCGVSSSRTSDWNFVSGRPWTMGQTWGEYGVDVMIINLSINDAFGSIATATMKANIQILIDQALVQNPAMKIILAIPNPYNDAATLQGDYAVAIAELGVENSLPVVDIRTAFGGDVATATANGYMADDRHPSSAGYDVIVPLYKDAITALYA